jgi:hypothetical protein
MMIREFIERKAFENLVANYPDKAIHVAFLVKLGNTPLVIAEWLANKKVIQGCIILLAANHMKKTGVRPGKEIANG